jgi:hypothetical protein
MGTMLVCFYLFYFRNDPKAARSRIDALESPAGPAHLYLQILKWASQTGLQIRITLMRIRIQLFHFNLEPDPAFHFNADRDPAFHFSAGRIQLLFKLWWESATCVHWSKDPLGLHFSACRPPLGASTALHGSIISLYRFRILTLMRILIKNFTLTRIRIKLFTLMRIRIKLSL